MVQSCKKGICMRKFLAFLFVVVCFIFTVQSALANNIKFVQITDAHVSAGSEFTQRVLEYAIKDINNQPGISFVVFTGDNISSPSADNLKKFKSIIKKLKVPYYIALGNHDVYKQNHLSKVQYFKSYGKVILLNFKGNQITNLQKTVLYF